MFDENKFLNNVYPGESRYILEPFCIENAEMEFFDLTQKPIFRKTFTLGNAKVTPKGFVIGDNCVACGICKGVCPRIFLLREKSIIFLQKTACIAADALKSVQFKTLNASINFFLNF